MEPRPSSLLSLFLSMLIITIATLPCTASAQEKTAAVPGPASDTSVVATLDEVVVTANRTALTWQKTTGAASVVTDRTVAAMPRGIAADEALGMVPGVRIENQADGERLHMSIRGQGILAEHGLRGIKVLLDGISLNDPTGFVSDLYDIDWDTVSRIEVLRGPSAALYGCASNAGVVNIITRDGGDKPARASTHESSGSNGFWKTLEQVNGSKGYSSYRLSYSHAQGNGSRHHQVYRGDVVSLKDVWTPSRNIVVTPVVNFSNYFNDNAEGLNDSLAHADPAQANSDAIPFNEYLKTTKMTGGLVVKAAVADNQSLDVTGFLRAITYHESNNHYFDIQSILTPGGSLQYNWDAKGSGFTNHLALGTDLQRQTINESELPHLRDTTRTEGTGDWTEDVIIPRDQPLLAAQTVTQSGVGAFLQEQVDIGKVTLMGNLRHDRVGNKLVDMLHASDSVTVSSPSNGDMNFTRTTGRIGASYSATEAVNIYADWGLGFLPPTTEELLSNPSRFGGFNGNLKPARSHGEELGVRGSIGRTALYELTGFRLDTKDDFYRYRLASRPQETFYGNGGDSRRLGAEAFVSWNPVKPLGIQLAYTYSNFKYVSNPTSADSIELQSLPHKDEWLPNSPPHQFNARLDYRFPSNLSFQLDATHSSKWYIYTDSRNANISQAGYTLYNARIGYDWRIGATGGDLSFSVKNIANKAWIAFTEPDLDDNGGPNNSYQPGPGREVFGGVSLRF